MTAPDDRREDRPPTLAELAAAEADRLEGERRPWSRVALAPAIEADPAAAAVRSVARRLYGQLRREAEAYAREGDPIAYAAAYVETWAAAAHELRIVIERHAEPLPEPTPAERIARTAYERWASARRAYDRAEAAACSVNGGTVRRDRARQWARTPRGLALAAQVEIERVRHARALDAAYPRRPAGGAS